jgi:hypothetical protein
LIWYCNIQIQRDCLSRGGVTQAPPVICFAVSCHDPSTAACTCKLDVFSPIPTSFILCCRGKVKRRGRPPPPPQRAASEQRASTEQQQQQQAEHAKPAGALHKNQTASPSLAAAFYRAFRCASPRSTHVGPRMQAPVRQWPVYALAGTSQQPAGTHHQHASSKQQAARRQQAAQAGAASKKKHAGE